jgi:hypothetical protein
MNITDRERLDLHRKLEATLGAKEADTLMAHLPPVTWHHLATKDDVRVLGVELRAEMQAMGDQLRAEMERGFARQTRWMTAVITAWSSVLLAAIAIFNGPLPQIT